jgi:predicted HicB family RNase H-like nuclease
MNNLTIYPDKELRKQLEKKCEEENRSLNNLIITILKKYVESQGKPKK